MATIGAVAYLNALPLISGLEDVPGLRVVTEVPARLFAGLENGTYDIALCPVIDAQRTSMPIEIVSSGAIGSSDQTMTVRLFSRRPFAKLERIHVDQESHTSVALLEVVFEQTCGRRPVLVPLGDTVTVTRNPSCDAVLLIGDKVVTREPPRSLFPHQLDLGHAWRELTGRPFVFATWLTRTGRDLGDLPQTLRQLRDRNLGELHRLVPKWAAQHDWPIDRAEVYLRDRLSYRFGPVENAALQLFWQRCQDLGLIPEVREVPIYQARQ